MDEYDGREFVGIDLHRRRSVIVRMTPDGQRIGPAVRIDNDPFDLAQQFYAMLDAADDFEPLHEPRRSPAYFAAAGCLRWAKRLYVSHDPRPIQVRAWVSRPPGE